jgi:two-component system, chemotaxis family, chemotaxis protein CheY
MKKAGFHLLVADDDAAMRYAIRRLVSRHYPEARITEAGDGREALKFYKNSRADLVILDYRMPQMDGLELLHAILAEPHPAPTIMISSHPIKAEAVAAGVTAYVDKGDLVKGLVQTIGTLLAQ